MLIITLFQKLECYENILKKEIPTKAAPSIRVPVVEFKAFKVYEDSNIDVGLKKQLQKNGKLENDKENEQDHVAAKEHVQSKIQDLILENSVIEESPVDLGSPMSIEKSFSQVQDVSISSSKTNKEAFFEIREFQQEIFFYLREKEVMLSSN